MNISNIWALIIIPDCMSPRHTKKKVDHKIEVFTHSSALFDHLHLDWEKWMNGSRTKYIQPYTHSYPHRYVQTPI